MTEVTIYHNPGCGTSRNTLALIRSAKRVAHMLNSAWLMHAGLTKS